MKKNLIIVGFIVTIIVIGIVILIPKPQDESTTLSSTPKQNEDEGKMVAGYSGKVLAGTTSPYLDFKKADYDKALADNKIIVLDFYANWCPICREEAPNLKAGFNELQTDKVVGFRVNYNDTETDNDEKELASNYSISYQHTKVILKDGKEVARSLESWDKETFLKEVNSTL